MDAFSFACQIKLTCNLVVTLACPFQIFAAIRQNQGNYTFPQHVYVHERERDSYLIVSGGQNSTEMRRIKSVFSLEGKVGFDLEVFTVLTEPKEGK